jgi:AAA15 family ATPase/GTPase
MSAAQETKNVAMELDARENKQGPMPRLMITKLVLTNFKSYAGICSKCVCVCVVRGVREAWGDCGLSPVVLWAVWMLIIMCMPPFYSVSFHSLLLLLHCHLLTTSLHIHTHLHYHPLAHTGEKIIGPFHKCFSSIVGPNGSGKSNVIDAMLFVFGKRATKIRLKKV